MKFSKRTIYILLVIVFTITIDQVSKVIVRAQITERTATNPGEQIALIKDYFILMNVRNEGAFLGMGSELNDSLRIILLLVLPILVLALVLHYLFKDRSLDNWSVFAFSSIIGGGISNVFDRIAFGSVTDFLYIKLTDLLRTGVFNLADLSVTIGMIILLFSSIKNRKKVTSKN